MSWTIRVAEFEDTEVLPAVERSAGMSKTLEIGSSTARAGLPSPHEVKYRVLATGHAIANAYIIHAAPASAML